MADTTTANNKKSINCNPCNEDRPTTKITAPTTTTAAANTHTNSEISSINAAIISDHHHANCNANDMIEVHLKLKVCRCHQKIGRKLANCNMSVSGDEKNVPNEIIRKKSSNKDIGKSDTSKNTADNSHAKCPINKMFKVKNRNVNDNSKIMNGDNDVLILKIRDLENTVEKTSTLNQWKNSNETNANGSGVNQTRSNQCSTKTKSIGTQHNSIKRVGSKKSGGGSELIVVSEDFKEQALKQNIVIDKKRKILKLMKSQKQNSKSLEDLPSSLTQEISVTSIKTVNSHDPLASSEMLKAISKSLDNVSQSSNGALDDVGSVELIFISDEFLNKATNSHRDIIIVNQDSPHRRLYSSMKDKSTRTREHMRKKTYSSDISNMIGDKLLSSASIAGSFSSAVHSNGKPKKIIEITEDFRRNSMKNKVIVLSDARKRLRDIKMKRNSSQESSVDDVQNKMTSHAFHSYDEEQEDLESKELKQTHL